MVSNSRLCLFRRVGETRPTEQKHTTTHTGPPEQNTRNKYATDSTHNTHPQSTQTHAKKQQHRLHVKHSQKTPTDPHAINTPYTHAKHTQQTDTQIHAKQMQQTWLAPGTFIASTTQLNAITARMKPRNTVHSTKRYRNTRKRLVCENRNRDDLLNGPSALSTSSSASFMLNSLPPNEMRLRNDCERVVDPNPNDPKVMVRLGALVESRPLSRATRGEAVSDISSVSDELRLVNVACKGSGSGGDTSTTKTFGMALGCIVVARRMPRGVFVLGVCL